MQEINIEVSDKKDNKRSVIQDYTNVDCGYVPIGHLIVPWSFLDHLRAACLNRVVVYGKILDASKMIREEIWAGLSDEERAAAPACLIYMMEQNAIHVLCFEPEPEAEKT